MRIKTIVDESFTEYREPVMYIGSISCDGKCCIEAGIPLSVCHNDGWRKNAILTMVDDDIIARYLKNNLTKAICFAGLEPFEQFEEVLDFVSRLRNEHRCLDPVIIYTGFDEDEVEVEVEALQAFKNIVIKFGRYIPGQESHYDEVLGVHLASDNQYARIIS